MSPRSYLPSAQFVVIVASVALSAGLVFAADRLTKNAAAPAQVVSATAQTSPDTNWESTLYSIQAAVASSSLPQAPDQTIVASLLQSAQGSNLTDSVGKTLLINLGNAKSQGLGDDIPTQNSIIAQASSQFGSNASARTYTLIDLRLTDDSDASLHAFGNALPALLIKHIRANQNDALIAIGYATDNQDQSQIEKLKAIEAEYHSLVLDLAILPVPKTLAPLYLTILNDYAGEAATFPDMEAALTDPLRGLSGLGHYQSQTDEAGRVFINIAQALSKDGILFTKDEPGSLWAYILSPQ